MTQMSEADLKSTILKHASPNVSPNILLRAIKHAHPKASKKQIIRAAFEAIIESAESDIESSRALHDFAMTERNSGDLG